jgi:hypothetical protein
MPARIKTFAPSHSDGRLKAANVRFNQGKSSASLPTNALASDAGDEIACQR